TGTSEEVEHAISAPVVGGNLQLAFDALAYSQTTVSHLRSIGSAVGLHVGNVPLGVSWSVGTDDSGAPEWTFASSLPGGSAFSLPTGSGFDRWVALGVVVDPANMQVYGTYDFGLGLQ